MVAVVDCHRDQHVCPRRENVRLMKWCRTTMSWDMPIVGRLLTTDTFPEASDPASPEMIQLLCDQHGLVADMVKTQLSLFDR
jgi:hypothetical protein